MNVLIVDDTAVDRKLLRATLEADGHHTSEAADGVDALAVLEREPTDAVISDILMPRMDGFRFCQEMRKSKRFGKLPFIFYTSTYTSPADEKLSLDIGGDRFLKKPASARTMIEALQEVVKGDCQRKTFDCPEELILTKDYNHVLVAKLEERNVELTARNEELEQMTQRLEQEAADRKQLEEQFVQSQKMEVVGQLAGGVAHDFNNILSVIIGYSDLLKGELKPEDPMRKFAEEIRFASDRAAALTRQLLVFSRKEALQPDVVDPNQLISGLDKMLRRLINEDIELTIEFEQKIGRIKADSGYFGQVLMNLVVNSRDALPHGGKISIATSNVSLGENYAQKHLAVRPGAYVMVSVTDTGVGMTEEIRAQLFKPFFTTKPKDKGTGLGLATCQTIVGHSAGHIAVETEVGKGTTFKIYFPRVDEPLTVPSASLAAAALPRGTETLLLVEDDPSLRHLALDILQGQGYDVLEASNGRDGLGMAFDHKGTRIRLVITDVIMPQMGGKVMADWLRTTLPEVKILFTSGYTGDAISQHGVLDAGAAFLPKPYTPGALAAKVRELLDAPA